MGKFWTLHYSIIKEAFQGLQRIRSAAVLIASFITAVVLAIHPQMGGLLSGVYESKSLTWPLVPLVVGVISTLVWANYKRHLNTEAERDALASEIEFLKKPQIDIEYSGVPPHKDFIDNRDIFCVAVRSKSKTNDLPLVNLYLEDITSIGGWHHNSGEQLLRQQGDNHLDDNPFKHDAILTPGQSLNYQFISRWREPERRAEIIIHYAIHGAGSIPSDRQYRITLKATASNCMAVCRQFLVIVDSQNRLGIEPLGPAKTII
jgi:hypothetical protein